MSGKLRFIFIAREAGARAAAVEQADLEPGGGIVSDRYYHGGGTFSKQLEGQPDSEVTLIESEAIDRFNAEFGLELGYGELRRNLVTDGVELNDLVGRQFRVGEVLLEGIRLCEPCAYLASTVASAVLPGLVHRAGLRASVISGGSIRPGDSITPESPG